MVIKVGMISFAHIHASAYADCLKQIPEQAQLAGIFDDNMERARAAGQQYNAPVFSSAEELLSQDIDAVMICSENIKHKPYTLLSAEAKKPIMCEKPIATNIADAQEMIDACQKNGVQLMIAFPCRYSAPIIRARQLVRSGKLGKIIGLKGTNRGTMPGSWFIQKELSGGGAVLDHTVHVIDVWRWMLEEEVVKVYAESGQLFYPDINIDDTGLLSVEFQGGAFGTLDTSWSRPNNSFPTWGDVTMEIVGEKGSITLDAFRQRVDVYNNDTVRAQWLSWTDDINLEMVKAFVKMVAEGEPSPVPGYAGFKAMEVALGAYRSIEQAVPVALPLSA